MKGLKEPCNFFNCLHDGFSSLQICIANPFGNQLDANRSYPPRKEHLKLLTQKCIDSDK